MSQRAKTNAGECQLAIQTSHELSSLFADMQNFNRNTGLQRTSIEQVAHFFFLVPSHLLFTFTSNPFLPFTMRVSSAFTTALLLCASGAAAFSPSANNANHRNIEAQSTLMEPPALVDGAVVAPKKTIKPPTLKADVSRPKWVVSSSTKEEAAPATIKAGLGHDEFLAKKKMIEEKRQWEEQKQNEVQSRVSMIRERYAARVAAKNGGLSP